MDVPLKIKGKYTIFEIFEGPRKSIQIWSKSWPKTGQKLARNWPKAGQNWPKAGQKLARSWPKTGQKWIKSWPEMDQKVIKRSSKISSKSDQKWKSDSPGEIALPKVFPRPAQCEKRRQTRRSSVNFPVARSFVSFLVQFDGLWRETLLWAFFF